MRGRKLSTIIGIVFTILLVAAVPAIASPYSHRDSNRHWDNRNSHWNNNSWFSSDSWYERNEDDDEDSSSDESDNSDSSDSDSSSTSSSSSVTDSADGSGQILSGSSQTITAELTGYSFQDNNPPGSADISGPVLHSKAGGTGTYADPITTAVPTGETPVGTRIYVAKIKRYVIVEDSGASKMGTRHFDIWVGGQGHSKSDSDACMNDFTGKSSVIINPGPGMAVTPGELTTSGGCKI